MEKTENEYKQAEIFQQHCSLQIKKKTKSRQLASELIACSNKKCIHIITKHKNIQTLQNKT